VPGQDLVDQAPEEDVVALYIDKAKYWNFVVDDIQRAQSDIAIVDRWSTVATERMKRRIEAPILGDIYADAHASNMGATAGVNTSAFNMGVSGTPVALDKTNILDYYAHAATILQEQNIPDDGTWWMVVPPVVENIVQRSDIKDASVTGDDKSPLRNGGRIGKIGRFTTYVTNNVDNVADGSGVTAHYLLFGHKMSLTFAMQMTKSETLRTEKTFGDKMRGLNVYGYKVVKPEALGVLYANVVLT